MSLGRGSEVWNKTCRFRHFPHIPTLHVHRLCRSTKAPTMKALGVSLENLYKMQEKMGRQFFARLLHGFGFRV